MSIDSCPATPSLNIAHIVGVAVGIIVGALLGALVGADDGVLVGADDGACVGTAVGAAVGASVHVEQPTSAPLARSLPGVAQPNPAEHRHWYSLHPVPNADAEQKHSPFVASHFAASMLEHVPPSVGLSVGACVGTFEGAAVGRFVGAWVGESVVGALVGADVGATVGFAVMQPSSRTLLTTPSSFA